MQYPLISEYIEAIRSAEDNFDKLSHLRPVLDANGNPVMSSGNFAVVFKMKDIETGKMYAVKCFTREQEEREERYREIIKVLEHVKSPYFVSTQYYDKELFVDTSQSDETEFPVLVMDWVEGVPLDEYMKSIADNQFYRELLANRFQKLVCWLLPQPFAHGDIKPDNIVVKDDGSIVLLDYDGMFVSALRGQEALENGTPLYRHAGRNSSFFNEYIDDYAAVLLLLLLKVNAITTIDIDDYLTDNSAVFLRRLEDYLNHSVIAPLLSAYIMVSTFGRLDRGQVSCMLSDNSDYNYDKVSVLQDLACKGDIVAMIELGNLFTNGTYVPKSTPKAMQWYILAKLSGSVDATCGLCKSIYYNTDFEVKNGIIQNQLRRSMVNFAYCREGERLHSDENYESAFYWFKKAADMGASTSQRILGLCYEKGDGVEKDFEKAIYWYQKAADNGNSEAKQRIGWCYKNGIGFQRDLKKAAYNFAKAAESGETTAQCNLALCYCKGEGVEKDFSKAVYWWQRAAESGDSTAQYNLALCYYKGEGVEKDFAKAVYWYRKAAESGNADAQFNLAYCYCSGEGVEKDLSKAVYLYQKAAEAGNSMAEQALNITCKLNKIYDVVNVKDGEISHVGECNTGLYSADGKRFLCYFGTSGYDYHIKEGTEFLCDDSFNDLYNECEGYNLSILYLPKSLKRIGDNVFCASISHISCESPNFKVKDGFLLSHDEKILYRYFGDNSIVHIPNGVIYIKGGAFSEKDIEKIIFPKNIFMYIGDNPFAGCYCIKEIETHGRYQVINKTLYDNFEKRLIGCWDDEASTIFIQSGTKRIGKNAFFGLSFQYIELPDSIEEIDETAFAWCSNLCKITIPSHQYKRIYNLIPSYIRKYVQEDSGLPF